MSFRDKIKGKGRDTHEGISGQKKASRSQGIPG